jgi:FkbM family methyltransferase
MNKTLVNLSRSSLFRFPFRKLQLHKFYNQWLKKFPRVKVLPKSGVTYRACRSESVSLAIEILEGGNCYDASLFPQNFTTFADLGCNVGYFTCWLAHHAKKRPLQGIMVDANPSVLIEAQWHIQTNQWKDVHLLQGALGMGEETNQIEFYVHEANTCSTAQMGELQLKEAKYYKKTTVPNLFFGKEWLEKMGNQRCHVLKVDIEGCEPEFFKTETQFLTLVDTIFVEWHKDRISLQELETFLQTQGFKLGKVIEDIGWCGSAFFKRV